MKKGLRVIAFAFILGIAAIVFACRGDKNARDEIPETMTSGKATFLVDNTIQPIAEDVLAVFLNIYDRASIRQVNKSETEVIRDLFADSARVAILPRKLTSDEEAYFRNRNIEVKATGFATDAIAFITNKKATDTVIQLSEVIKILKGGTSARIPKLVFDNRNSSTVSYMLQIAGVSKFPANVHALKNNEEVIKYVHDNDGAIGVIGINWMLQSPESLSQYVENIEVLAVDNVKIDKSGKTFYKPNQTNIATGSYPLTRKLYVLNYQGKQGLGMGFANYVSAPDGQRIILKSGLVPVEVPKRELEIRNEL